MFTADQWLPWRQNGSEFHGPGFISGTLKVNGLPATRRIYLTERATYRLVATTLSNTDGTYRFDGLDPEVEFDLRSQDWARVRRDDVASAVTPSTRPILTNHTVSVPIGTPFVWSVPVAYGRKPLTWSATGTLPSGLTFADGAFTGAWPTGAPGQYPLTVLVTDANGEQASASIALQLVLLPLQLTASPDVPDVLAVNGAMTLITFVASGGEGPYTYSVSEGSLPSGTSLDPVTGVWSGTPDTADEYSFTIKATGVRGSAEKQYVVGAVDVDPHWSNVVALMHFDGANNSTTFSDETGRVWTGSGNAKLSTAHSRRGVSSLDLDGTGSYLSTASSADLSLSGQDATIEMSVRLRTAKPTATLVTKRPSSGNATEYFMRLSNGLPAIVAWDANGNEVLNLVSSGPPLLIDVWYDIALSIVGTTWRLFVDGQKVAEGTPSGPVATNSQPVHFGRDPSNSDRNPDAYIDELRWTRGVGRYTSNYTPATGPFPSVGP